MPHRKTVQNKRYSIDSLGKKTRNTEFYNGKKDVENLGAGDSYYIAKFCKDSRSETFTNILHECQFIQMFHFTDKEVDRIPRMVIGQTDKKDPKSAIYRMPGCNEKNIPTTHWTPTVKEIRDEASTYLEQDLNHCVATLFRDQDDSLGFHKDKLLDLEDDTVILSISFGSTRPIVFQSEDGKYEQTIMLKPGSLLAIGPKTNKHYYHSIPKLDEETDPRISLSFRTIATYVKEDDGTISGQGDEYQTVNYPFVKNYEEEGYTDEQGIIIKELKEKAAEELSTIRTTYPLSL